MDYGYVVGTFIRPLGAPAPTDRGAHGTVRLIPHDVRKLDSPSRETGKINETLTMDAAGHVEGWFVTGVYSVSVVYCDGTRRPMFDVRVEATHTVASPLDLVTAAPPIPSPEVVVIVSEAERIRAEAAADRAQASADEASAVLDIAVVDGSTATGRLILTTHGGEVIDAGDVGGEIFSFVNLSELATTPAGPAVWEYDPANPPTDSPLPDISLSRRQSIAGMITWRSGVASFSGIVRGAWIYGSCDPANDYYGWLEMAPLPEPPILIPNSVPVGSDDGTFWSSVRVGSALNPNNLDEIPIRDFNGQFEVGEPTAAKQVATKGYVDSTLPVSVDSWDEILGLENGIEVLVTLTQEILDKELTAPAPPASGWPGNFAPDSKLHGYVSAASSPGVYSVSTITMVDSNLVLQVVAFDGDEIRYSVDTLYFGPVQVLPDADFTVPMAYRGQWKTVNTSVTSDSYKLIRRDDLGRAQITDPAVAADIATKGYVDKLAATLAPSSTSASGSQSLASVAQSTVIHWTMAGNVTVTAMPSSPAPGLTVSLVLTQDATAGRTLTLPASVKLPSGLPLPLTATSGGVDVVHLWWTGAVWIGALAGRDLR